MAGHYRDLANAAGEEQFDRALERRNTRNRQERLEPAHTRRVTRRQHERRNHGCPIVLFSLVSREHTSYHQLEAA